MRRRRSCCCRCSPSLARQANGTPFFSSTICISYCCCCFLIGLKLAEVDAVAAAFCVALPILRAFHCSSCGNSHTSRPTSFIKSFLILLLPLMTPPVSPVLLLLELLLLSPLMLLVLLSGHTGGSEALRA